MREVLAALWAGTVPTGLPAELQTRFADAIRNSGLKAAEEASQAAHAADPRSKRREAKKAAAGQT